MTFTLSSGLNVVVLKVPTLMFGKLFLWVFLIFHSLFVALLGKDRKFLFGRIVGWRIKPFKVFDVLCLMSDNESVKSSFYLAILLGD